jgi:NADH-quinone oxidoreductase subunit G
MPKIIIDGKTIETRAGIPVLQAAIEMGLDVPHYCYHPGLSIVASCRLCLMEMKMPNPKTGEQDWSPKLAPSCQTPVRDGMEVRFNSDKVRANQSSCMEFFLLNHPLDCPVCDQAGECYLQDYSYKFGKPESRMVDQKYVNPKKDVGSKTLLYADRCVLCSRCTRFTDEVAGTGELGITNRGSKCEIDVFPGKSLENALQGNVVDICPVGALLDKDFLFKQRVWFLRDTNSVCPHCSTGCTIHIDHNDGVVQRLKPRYNPGVNDWWMCDEGRFGYKHVHDPNRLAALKMRRGDSVEQADWAGFADSLRFRLGEIVKNKGAGKIAVVLSPFAACEEAFLLATAVRELDAQATLVLGKVPVVGEDQKFPTGAADGKVKFVIRQEKCPNRLGIEAVIAGLGGPTATLAEFLERAAKGEFAAVWIAGGYLAPWVDKDWEKLVGKVGWLVVQDLFPSKLSDAAHVVIPACAVAERAGSFMNATGKLQPFEWAVRPPEGCKRDGQFLYELAGLEGVYNAGRVRELMGAKIPALAEVWTPPLLPVHQH